MNRFKATISVLLLAAFAQTAVSQPLVKLLPVSKAALTDIPEQTIIDEDFSRLTAGTETEPDTVPLVRTTDENYPYIDDKWFSTPGWAGQCDYQAGGTLALNGPDGVGGFIMLPPADLSGELTVTFRAKPVGSQTVRYLSVGATKGGVWYPDVVSDNSYKFWTVRSTSGWKDYTLTIDNTYGGSDCRIEINSQFGGVLIDDVKVTKRQTFLAAPILKSATDFTLDGFTANWEPVSAATNYLLTVYRQVPTSEEDSVRLTENFDNLNVVDGEIQGMPDNALSGWTINLAQGNKQVFTEGEDGCISAPYSLCMDNDNDTIVFPANGGTISHFNTRIKRVRVADDANPTMGVDLYDGTKWVNLTHFYVSSGIPDGVAQLLLDYSIASGTFYQVRLTCHNFGDSTLIALDDFEMTTTTPTEREYAFIDREVADTSVVLTGLDSESDYYYTVKAENKTYGMVSETPDNVIFAFGVSAPVAIEPTDIEERGAYTANWEKTPKADAYILNTYDVYSAPESVVGHAVLSEDFSKSTIGTESNPVYMNNYSGLIPLDDYTDNPGWYGYVTTAANGMIGGEDGAEYEMRSEIQSPEIYTANDGGQYIVTVTACSPDSDYLVVMNSSGYTTAVALTKDMKTFDVPMTGGKEDDIIVFAAYGARSFFIDKVVVSQNLAKGDKCPVLSSTRRIGGDTLSLRVNGLNEVDDTYYAYDVQAVHTKGSRTATSKKSNRVIVDLFGTGIQSVEADGQDSALRVYDISGRYIGNKIPAGGKGLYILRQGGKSSKVITRR